MWDARSKILDKAFEVNKQVAAFFERLMYINLDTISLSVTAMASLDPGLAFLTKLDISFSFGSAWHGLPRGTRYSKQASTCPTEGGLYLILNLWFCDLRGASGFLSFCGHPCLGNSGASSSTNNPAHMRVRAWITSTLM
jgi:hypothetical protein